MKRWYKQGKAITEIAELLDRDRTTVSGHVHADGKDDSSNPVGRPRKIQEQESHRQSSGRNVWPKKLVGKNTEN